MSRESFLAQVPEEIWNDTCRCLALLQHEFNKDRNMYVCSNCKKPQGYIPSQYRSYIVKYCDIHEGYWVLYETCRNGECKDCPKCQTDMICPDCEAQF